MQKRILFVCIILQPPPPKKKVLLILGVNANNRPSYVFFYVINERTMSFSL